MSAMKSIKFFPEIKGGFKVTFLLLMYLEVNVLRIKNSENVVRDGCF